MQSVLLSIEATSAIIWSPDQQLEPWGELLTGKTTTRADLIDVIHHDVGLGRTDCARMVEDVLGQLADAIVAGEQVKISGFGSFLVNQKSERVGRNPKTGVSARITARRVVTFRPSANLKDRVNSGTEPE